MTNSRILTNKFYIHPMEAQIVPSRSLAFTEQTADHASLDGMVIASIRLPPMRHPAGKHDAPAAHSRHQSQFQPGRDTGAGGRLEAAWLRARTRDCLRDADRGALRN